jgi:lipid A disaccharide synthetase
VPEIFQDEATPEVLCQALLNLVFDKDVKARQVKAYQAIHDRLRQNATEKLAEALLPMLHVTPAAGGAPSATARAGGGGT